MDFYASVEEVLSRRFVHFFGYMPDFGENKIPDKYCVYTGRENNAAFSSGEPLIREFVLFIDIITLKREYDLYRLVEGDFKAAGFVFCRSRVIFLNDTSYGNYYIGFPLRYRYQMEFLKSRPN
ncbi:MAG: hypothetical protein LBI38_07065 [Oscillospiraceae bacterium]|jgi:hypothetical protein|nr:hypothetical protein [Oscillospiraceae bacterium]